MSGNVQSNTKYTRKPFLVVSKEKSARKDVYGSIEDNIVRQAQLLRGEADSDTVIIAMHPIGSPAYLPLFSELARAGMHLIGCTTRYTVGDSAFQAENMLLDLGACVRDARERFGYKNVILAGWSGGGFSLMGYQAEAENPVIRKTAAGEPTLVAETRLPAADGVLFLAAHRSRHHLLTDFLDASITNELEPDKGRIREFNLYDPANPNQPPYSDDFLTAYRSAQRERSRRITAFAQEKLESLKRGGEPDAEFGFVVQGTMADPRWLDPAVEPNGRKPGWSYLGDPKIANMSPGALMRFTTTRSWLSQWALDTAQLDAADAAGRLSVPVLVLVNGCDDAVPVSHGTTVFGAIRHAKKEFVELPDANHYFSGSDQRGELSRAAAHVRAWMEQYDFL